MSKQPKTDSDMAKMLSQLGKNDLLLIKASVEVLYARQLMDSGKRAG